MINMAKEVRQGKFVVFDLPRGINVSGYSAVPRMAATVASSAKDAVGHVVMRSEGMTRKNGRIVLGTINREYGGTSRYAIEIPEIAERYCGEEEKASDEHRQMASIGNIAEQLAEIGGRNRTTHEDVLKAREIYDFSERN
jgi:hypothetical protein